MSVPNYYQTVVETANKWPQEFREAHTGGARTELWIRILAYELYKKDYRWGLNGKRGDRNVISQDAVAYQGIGIGYDVHDNNRPCTVVDVIGAAGGPNPTPTWQVLNDPNKHVGPMTWIQPQPIPGYHQIGPSVPAPPPVEPVPTAPNLDVINAITKLTAQLTATMERLAAVEFSLNASVQANRELREELERQAEADYTAAVKINTETVGRLANQLDRGFSIRSKAGWPIGEITGEVTLKGQD